MKVKIFREVSTVILQKQINDFVDSIKGNDGYVLNTVVAIEPPQPGFNGQIVVLIYWDTNTDDDDDLPF